MQTNKTAEVLLLMLFFVLAPFLRAQHTPSFLLRNYLENYQHTSQRIQVDSIPLFASSLMYEIYAANGFKPFWASKERQMELFDIIYEAEYEGLNPHDYHLSAMLAKYNELKDNPSDIYLQTELDLLMTDALILYASHLRFGKVRNEMIKQDWEIGRYEVKGDPVAIVFNALSEKSPKVFMERLKPDHFMYTGLRGLLDKYRKIRDVYGGWDSIPEGKAIKPGMQDERLKLILKRLRLIQFLGDDYQLSDSMVYDSIMLEAVKSFQYHNNLNPDGVIGKNTIKAFNVSVQDRINTIKVNLERGRWVLNSLPDDFIVVNIAGYNLRRVKNNEIVFHSPVIVGKTYHKTPVFKAPMTYVVINPTWTVPPGIIAKETLPKLKNDPGYLEAHNMDLLSFSGEKVDPYSVDFEKLSASNFPYMVRQRPGPDNSLGRIKYMFPNSHFVFIHDTPNHALFEREERAFSHGCIRLKDRYGLLENIMADSLNWSIEKIEERVATKETQTINLKQPIEVLILYWTAGVDPKSFKAFFNPDIYDRDTEILHILEEHNAYLRFSPQ